MGPADGHNLVHPGPHLQRLLQFGIGSPHDADHRALHTLGYMTTEPHLGESLKNVRQLPFSVPLLHYDEHLLYLHAPFFAAAPRSQFHSSLNINMDDLPCTLFRIKKDQDTQAHGQAARDVHLMPT